MPARPHVLIIGGGIAGSAAALFLHRAGVRSTVYEAYPQRAATGGALGLAPNGMSVLSRLGLAEKALAAGTVVDRFVFHSPSGKAWGSMPWGPVGRYA